MSCLGMFFIFSGDLRTYGSAQISEVNTMSIPKLPATMIHTEPVLWAFQPISTTPATIVKRLKTVLEVHLGESSHLAQLGRRAWATQES